MGAMMADRYEQQRALNGPFEGGQAIDVSGGDVTLATASRGFYAAFGGAVAIETVEGAVVTLTIGDGSYHPWRVARFLQAGTTAAGLVAGW